MKAPTSLFDRPGRATAVVGAVVAVSATAAVALLSGTATAMPDAAQPGKCTKNVNVRSEPDATSRIVALCEAGTAVQVAESRDGFLRLTNLGGWAAQEYVSVNGRAPASAERAANSEDGDTEDADDRRASRATDDARESGRAGRHGGGTGSGTESRAGDSSAGDSSADESSTDESSTDENGDAADPAETGESDDSEVPSRRQAGPGGIGGLIG
jgi:hypothetical protein